jgi:hypothetical protein
VEQTQSNLRRGPKSKLLPFLKGPMKVMTINGDRYLLRNLIPRKDKEYHVKQLFEYTYDPTTPSPLKVACKDDGSKYPSNSLRKVEVTSRIRSNFNLVHWIDYDEPTWNMGECAEYMCSVGGL